MSEDLIRYDIIIQDALRGAVKKILNEVARTGLPGEHHFYIAFDTTAPGVRISPRLRERYPQEMTIVLQHQFWDLEVGEQTFEVGLSFQNTPERLLVPFKAIRAFADPHVNFGLKFDTVPASEEKPAAPVAISDPDDTPPPRPPRPDAAPNAREGASRAKEEGADVVSLDAFRKK